jgi:transcriptional regulator with XRE-family HTH domain
MARARPALQQAINAILERHGSNGRRMSLRQAERQTGLSPATIGELAKGNARTPETLRRFAQGFGVDADRLLLLGGFVPDDTELPAAERSAPTEMEPDEREWLGRFGQALAKMPPGRERDLWKENLRRDTELIEAFLERLEREEAQSEATPREEGRTNA